MYASLELLEKNCNVLDCKKQHNIIKYAILVEKRRKAFGERAAREEMRKG